MPLVRPPRRRPTAARIARFGVQFGMVALISYVALRHQIVGGRGGAAPLDSFCPFGAIETIPALVSGSGFIGKVGSSNLVLLGSLALVSLGFGGAFCGWLCPFGAVQDWLSYLGRLIFKRQYRVPERVHRYLKHLRWGVLALIVWMSAKYLTLWFAEYDPFRAMFHFKFENAIAVGLVVGTVVLSLTVERFWCLYLCPLGALVGLGAIFGFTKVHRFSSCTDCGVCSAACPMRVPVDGVASVSDQHCTMCTECVDACPTGGALRISTGAQSESLRPVAVGVAAFLLFFALIGTGWAMGWWQTGQGCGGCAEWPGTSKSQLAAAAFPEPASSIE